MHSITTLSRKNVTKNTDLPLNAIVKLDTTITKRYGSTVEEFAKVVERKIGECACNRCLLRNMRCSVILSCIKNKRADGLDVHLVSCTEWGTELQSATYQKHTR